MSKSHLDKYFLAAIVESSEDSIVSVDFDLNITSWNNAAERLYGYPADEVIGKPLTTLTLDRALAGLIDKVEQIRALGTVERFKTERVKKNGERMFLEIVMSPVKDDDGQVIGVSTIARDITVRQIAADVLKEKERLRSLVAAQERTRARIALDLHDELGQHVTAIRLKLQGAEYACNEPALLEILKEIEELAKGLDDSVSLLSRELRPHELNGKGIAGAITDYVMQSASRFGLRAAVSADGVHDARFDPDAEANIYCVVQEAFNNTLKHAQATKVEVIFKKRDGEFVLIYSDDGTGFDANNGPEHPDGLGLIGMNERAQLIGAELEIESAPGQGTSVFLRFPASLQQ